MRRANYRISDGIMPRNKELTAEIDKTKRMHPKNYVPFKDRKKNNVIGRFTPPVSHKPKPVTLPKLKFLDDEEPVS